MSVNIRSEVLRHQLALRGLSGLDLARKAGLSSATVSAAMTGHAISARSLQQIAMTLTRIPVIEGVDELVVAGSDPPALGSL